jgi:hypothetical protein
MNNQNAYGVKRLESKTAREAIIQKIASDFNLMPIIAEAYYKQISSYFDQHANVQLSSGQICYEAVATDEPAGKHIALTRKVSCRLSLNDVNADFEVLTNYGLAGLRRHRILRLTRETYDQGALLTQLDLAVLLNCCDAVVSDYVNEYQRASGRILPTRGNIHDLSGAITHKCEIITLYLQGCLTPTIAGKTKHSKEAVDRYIRDYENVKLIRAVTDDVEKISQLTHLSKRVIEQYLVLIPEDELKNLKNQ